MIKKNYFQLTHKNLVDMGYSMDPTPTVREDGLVYHKLYKNGLLRSIYIVQGQRGRRKSYAMYKIGKTTVSAAKLTWIWFNGSVPDGEDIDHIDNDSLNNNISNLQTLKHRENCMKKYQDNPAYKELDVHWCKYARFCKFGKCQDMSEEEVKEFLAKREMLV